MSESSGRRSAAGRVRGKEWTRRQTLRESTCENLEHVWSASPIHSRLFFSNMEINESTATWSRTVELIHTYTHLHTLTHTYTHTHTHTHTHTQRRAGKQVMIYE